MSNLKEENLKLKMELATIIMGYENELVKEKRHEISDFSKNCMKRYFELMQQLSEEKNASAI